MNGFLQNTRYAVATLALLGPAIMQTAQADAVTSTLVPQESIFFQGVESTVLSVNTSGAGTVSVDVTDFEWPVALSSLSFAAASDSQVLKTQTESNPGRDFTFTFDVGSAGSFYAQISAIAGASQFAFPFPSIGAYSLDVTFTQQASPVPLPPAVWLLATGLLGFAAFSWVRRRRAFPVSLSLGPTPVC